MMIKTIDSWDYPFDTSTNHMVKVASDGRLKGSDKARFLKYAGEEGLSRFQKAAMFPGEEPVIQIALGCTESFGPNRNADGFRKKACREQHSTFVKMAKAFRDHNNSSSDPSYGRVVDSWFNESRGRIELLVGLNATKSAAERNDPEHGRIAELELQALEKRGSYPVSMSSLVPYDQCSSCQNKAKKRSDYCDASMCKHGGLKRNLGRIMEDGHHLHADNPINNWCDISHITEGRQADRIAYSLGKMAREEGMKSASESGYISDYKLPWALEAEYWSALRELADREELKSASDLRFTDAYSPTVYRLKSAAPDMDLADACAASASGNWILPLEDFLEFATPGGAKYASVVRESLPHAFSSLRSDPDVEDRLFRAASAVQKPIPSSIRNWAVKEARFLGNNIESIRSRIVEANLLPNPPRIKSAGVALGPGMDLAKEYAAYALAVRVQGLNKNARTVVDVNHLLSLNNV